MEEKLKHLDYIHATIARMASHSFAVKGWSITLVSALFALAAKDANVRFVLVAYFPILMFWVLDAFFLHQEWLFRALYDVVRQQDPATVTIDLSMDTTSYRNTSNSWANAFVSKTLWPFHGCIVLVTILAILALLTTQNQ